METSTKCRILVASDPQEGLQLARNALQRYDCDVVTVSDGRKVVSVAAGRHFDVVFLDFQLQHLEPQPAALAIRALASQRGQATAIVGMRRASGDVIEGLDEVLALPYCADSLHEVLDRCSLAPFRVLRAERRDAEQPALQCRRR